MTNLAEGFNLQGPPIPDGIYVAWTFDFEKGLAATYVPPAIFWCEDEVVAYLKRRGGRYRVAARFHDQLPVTIAKDGS